MFALFSRFAPATLKVFMLLSSFALLAITSSTGAVLGCTIRATFSAESTRLQENHWEYR